jgi:OFA family oxalate/formate antiporter-like MFS transporter
MMMVGSAEKQKSLRPWAVLLGLFTLYAATNGIIMHTLPLMYPELIEEFGWTEIQVTLPATVFFVIGAITSPPAGVLLDRFSPRLIMIVGASGIVIAIALYSTVSALWQLVAIYAMLGVFLSMSGLVSNMLVLSRWFSRHRGRATGILLMASSLGGVVFPLVMGRGIEQFGWRHTMLGFAFIGAVMMLLPLLALIRNNPADLGLGPDGLVRSGTGDQPDGQTGEQRRIPPVAAGPTLREALSGQNFYLVAFATAAVWFAIIALVQHQSIYLGRDLGVDRALIPVIFSTFFASSVVGKLVFGLLSDRFRTDRVLASSIAVLIIGLVILRQADGQENFVLYAYAVIAGIGFSGAFTSIQLLIARFYAGRSYGKILAVLVLVDTLAGALGTRVIAEIRNSTESYLPAIDVLVVASLVAIGAILFMRNPDRVEQDLIKQENTST